MQLDRLQKIAVALMSVLVLISFALANIQSFIWIQSDWLVSTILPAVVVTETNGARAAEDLPPLVRNELLDRAAQLKAEDMAAKGYFAHKSPDGVTPWYWFREIGYSYAFAGENLAVHFTDSHAVVEAWLKSPSHRANVMNNDYREIGIGTAKGEYEGYDTVFVVQLFGTPAVPPPPTPIARPTSPQPQAVARVEIPLVEEIVVEEVVAEEVVVEEPAVVLSETALGTAVLETFAATETPGAVLAEIAPQTPSAAPPASFVENMVTSPSMALQVAYGTIGLIVIMLLSYTLVFEWRHHHPRQTAYSVALLFVMIGLFALHTFILKVAVVS